MYDVIIIGGGPAGFTAALYASRAKLNTLLIEKAFSGGQMATTFEMENYPGFEEPISGTDLAMRMENQAKRFGTQVVYDTVTELALDTVIKTVRTENAIYQSKVVILCMGAAPKELELPKEKELRGMGVSYCATCDGAFYRDADIAVIGGGDTAAEDAIFLTRFSKKIYIVHRRESLRATKVIQDALFSNKKVEFVWNSTVEEILGDKEVKGIRVKNVKTGSSSEIPVEGIFVAIGNTPNTRLLQGKIELNGAGYIVTDDNMQTNMFGVYAAGDIREKPLRQVITAASDGAVAAYMAERYIADNQW